MKSIESGLLYVLFSVLTPFKSALSRQEGMQSSETSSELVWLVRSLAGAVFIAFVFLLVFFWAAMRYVLDFMPMLMLLSLIGYCQAYTAAKARGRERYIVVLGILLAVLSIMFSQLLGISSSLKLFERKNPAMLNWFMELFG